MCRERWWRSRKHSWQMGHVRASALSLLECRLGPACSFLWWDLMWKTRSDVRRKDRLQLAHQFWVDRPREVSVGGSRAQELVEDDDGGVGIWTVACLSHSAGAPRKVPQRGACGGPVAGSRNHPPKAWSWKVDPSK